MGHRRELMCGKRGGPGKWVDVRARGGMGPGKRS